MIGLDTRKVKLSKGLSEAVNRIGYAIQWINEKYTDCNQLSMICRNDSWMLCSEDHFTTRSGLQVCTPMGYRYCEAPRVL